MHEGERFIFTRISLHIYLQILFTTVTEWSAVLCLLWISNDGMVAGHSDSVARTPEVLEPECSLCGNTHMASVW